MTVPGAPPPPLSSDPALMRFVEATEALLDEAATSHAWSLTPSELAEALPRLTRIKARLAGVELRVLREADRQAVGDDVGATNTAHWWAHATGQRIPAARSAARLAEQLDSGHEPAREALAGGRVNVDQARVIVDAVDSLPANLGPGLLADAEAHLVGLADLDGDLRLDPKALRIAGRKILEVVAPEVAEAHEASLLEAEERQALATATFSMRPDGHGSMIGRFKIPVLQGAMLAKHLDAIAAPRHQRATGRPAAQAGATVSRPLRLGEAFVEYLQTRETSRLPKAGGVAATVVVTMTLENLLGDLEGSERGALLDTGERISAAEFRRLACEAGIIPAVLGSPSQPLDLGRKTRFHTEPQRIALMLKHGGCAVVGCDWPPGMCHAHHPTAWSKGGGTSVQNGILICPRHHVLAHDSRYQLKTDKQGRVTFAKRT